MPKKTVPEVHRAQYRLPPDLAAWLKARAEENSRSMNGEIVALLKTLRKQEEQGYVV